jgi:hypothetical protein
MKNICAVLFSALALTALADSPSYVTKSKSAAAASVEVIFPADPVLQIRVVGVIGSSDLSSSTFSFTGGGTAQIITLANTNTAATNIVIMATNGFAANDIIIVSSAATNRSMTIGGFVNTTNVYLTGALGFAQTAGMDVYDMSAASTLGLGATTNKAYTGEAIYVAPRGRPMRLVVSGTSYSSVDAASVHYDP